MLKKIFVCVFAGMVFVAGANAAVDARRECVKNNGSRFFPDYKDVKPAINSDYAIYFDNDKSDIPGVCAKEVKTNVIDKLKANANDIETVLLIGSADSTGNSQYNAELAQKRVNTVNKLLQSAGVPVCKYDRESRCARISMGEAFDSAAGYDNDSDYYLRAVFMFVIYKGDICDEKTIKALNALIKVLPNDSSLKHAQEICNSNKKDQMLLRSQRQKIVAAMADAIANYPEKTKTVVENLPADLSAKILADGIIAVRDSLAASASVWKKADGSFNTARLASDSIAGVVLGTAGGIITSNVVKKNQIKTGFEDVMCTVGGQNVANWGDEFRVGVK